MRRLIFLALVALLATPSIAFAVPLGLSARAAFLIEPDTGEVLYAQGADDELAIGSTTKMMTALITVEHAPLTARVTVPYYPRGGDQSTANLQTGQVISIADLIRAMMLPSANEAAYTLAVRVGGTESAFIAMMNAKARELGLTHTHYSTPVGLDTPGNYSSARDLARLAQVILANSFIAATVRSPQVALNSIGGRVVVNRNDLLGRYPFVIGVKTGTTDDAGSCLVAAAELDGVRLISVVLGDPTDAVRDDDTMTLLRYGLRRLHRVRAVTADQVYAHAKIAGHGGSGAALIAAEDLDVVVPRGSSLAFEVEGVKKPLRGPLASGVRVGTLVVDRGADAIGSVPLLTLAAVPAPSGTSIGLLLVFGFALFVGCSLLLMGIRRRSGSSS